MRFFTLFRLLLQQKKAQGSFTIGWLGKALFILAALVVLIILIALWIAQGEGLRSQIFGWLG